MAMTKAKKDAQKRKNRAQDDIQAILGRMVGHADNYMIAVCEVVTYSRDGSSKAAIEQVQGAIRHTYDVKELSRLLQEVLC